MGVIGRRLTQWCVAGCADLHLLDMLSPQERKRQGYTHELILTEENYVNDLQLVTEVHIRTDTPGHTHPDRHTRTYTSGPTHLDIHIYSFSRPFIQINFQERALQKVHRSMIIKNEIAPNIAGSQNMKHTYTPEHTHPDIHTPRHAHPATYQATHTLINTHICEMTSSETSIAHARVC